MMKKQLNFYVATFCLLIFLSLSSYAGIFDKSEYATRRQKLMEKIPDGIAIIRGAHLNGGYMDYYQNNNFLYFSGIEIPDAILIIDGLRRESMLFFTTTERGYQENT